MSALSDNSSLLIAGLDLSLVRLIRQAIRTADISGAAGVGSGHVAPARSASHAAVETVSASVGIRNADRPAASFEPCRVHHLNPRLNALQPYTCTRPVLPADFKSSIQPPWKVLPWPAANNPHSLQGHRTIKVPPKYTDEYNVGRTLDLFV